jgi:YegS/Rv2252/BmrU family lipid kinase
MARTLVIANPMSRAGKTGRHLDAVEARIRSVLGEVEVARTQAPRDAERLAREGVRAGSERILVVGGDGTLSEVVSGLLAAGLGRHARIGLLPMGTGGDFVRSLGVPRALERALTCIAEGHTRILDAGKVEFRTPEGARRTAYFMNVASLGISGLTDTLVNRAPKFLGGRASFLIGTLRALLQYRPPPVTLRVDGEQVHEGPLVLAAAGNGRCFGGGMQVAPEAQLDDGRLEIIVVGGSSKLRLLVKLPRLYAGTHLGEPEVSHHPGRVLEADSPEDVWIDVDGEPLGLLPLRCEVLPAAVELLVPK